MSQLKTNHQIWAFKIWYSNSTYWGETYEDWLKAPSDDVQVVMIYFERTDGQGRPTRLHAAGCDYYAMTEDMSFSSDFDDISKVEGHVLLGKYMDFDGLIEIEKEAYDDYGEGWLVPAKPEPSDMIDISAGGKVPKMIKKPNNRGKS